MWARIENNTVVELTDIDPSGRFHQSIQWIACSGEVDINWTYDGSNFIESYTPTEEELLQQEREGMVVSKFQAKAALKQASLLDQVQQYIDSLSVDDLTRLAWEDAQEFRRLSPTIETVATELSLTDVQVDDLFRNAKTIEA